MFGLENLSDTQRKALLIGVPAVALVAVGTRIGKKSTAPAVETDTPSSAPPTGYIPAASTDAIGVGQLADFESKITQAIQRLHLTPAPTPTTPTTPTAPAPSAYDAAIGRLRGGDYSLGAFDQWRAAGGSVNAPEFVALVNKNTAAWGPFVTWWRARGLGWPYA